SGAIVVHGGYPRLQSERLWLEEDLERIAFPGHLSPTDRQGRRWLMSCHAWRLSPRSLYGADVLAGVLAGAKRQRFADSIWLVLPRSPSVVSLLDSWKLSVCEGANKSELWVSVFYGALLARRMPVATAKSMVVKRAGACPLLPM